MARRVRAELTRADTEARRFVRTQLAEAKRLGYPTMAAFAKDMARGTVSLAPTPEDPYLEFVGRFVWGLPDVERYLIASHYGDEYTTHIKARRLSMSLNRYRRTLDRVLVRLSGYLMDR